MRSSLRSILAVTMAMSLALLVSACGSHVSAAVGRSAASKAQQTIKEMYDALVAGVGGEPTSGRGAFVNCGLGNNSLDWVFTGYLQGAAGADLAARAGGALAAAGFERTPADQAHRTLDVFSRGGLEITMDVTPQTGWLNLHAKTSCQRYDTASADELKAAPAWTYGKGLPGS